METYENIILITGGAGFIGSALVRYLNDTLTNNIVIVDNLGCSEKWKNLVGKNFKEIIHKDQLFHWLDGKEEAIAAIVHLGACSSTVETNAHYLLENNYRYSKNLAEFAFYNDIRFIYASSAATYGDGSKGFSDEHSTIEGYTPLNMYGYSKQLFDLWLRRENHLDKVVGLKYFNVFGPNEYHKGRMASAILKMVAGTLNHQVIKLFKSNHRDYADGGQVRDFIYVKDVVKMTAQFLKNEETGLFNIGLGKPHSWNELAQAVIDALHVDAKIEYIDMPVDLAGKYQNYTCADMSKSIKRGLCMPEYSLKESVKDYVCNYLLEGKTW